jgi:acetyl-CoA synthetase
LLKEQTLSYNDEGRDIWLQPLLDEASDNSVAEIMDSEDPLFILYTSGSTGKPKEWFTYTAGIWFIPLILLKMFSIMKKTTSFGVRLILVGLRVILILYGPLNGATTVILKGFLLILILVVLGNYRKHKVTQFYAPTAIRALAKRMLIMFKTSFKTLK